MLVPLFTIVKYEVSEQSMAVRMSRQGSYSLPRMNIGIASISLQ